MIRNDEFEVVHAVAAGLDVHKMQITASIRRSCGPGDSQVETRQFNTLPSGHESLVKWLKSEAVEAALMEGTGVFWLPVFEALEEAGLNALLVHAHKVKQLKGRKTDVDDSRRLARVCQFGLCGWSFVPDQTFRDMRKASRHRRKLMQSRASVQNRVHKLLDGAGIPIGGILTDIFGFNGTNVLNGLRDGKNLEEIMSTLTKHVKKKLPLIREALGRRLSDVQRFLLDELMLERDQMTTRIECAEAQLELVLTTWQEDLQLLQTIPGIDEHSARALLAEIGPDVKVFDKVAQFAAWCGVCPGNNESAGKRRHSAARQGNSHNRAILNQCAHAAARTKNTQFHSRHKMLRARQGYKRAIVSTAHKLAKVIYAVLRDRAPCHDPEIDYEQLVVGRNAPRWLKMLKEYGYIEQR